MSKPEEKAQASKSTTMKDRTMIANYSRSHNTLGRVLLVLFGFELELKKIGVMRGESVMR